ncbi:hypothetical protein L6R29_24810 [Myxococcota bacterium]|nr:hypothetical protein [Myxococcota bacterium]
MKQRNIRLLTVFWGLGLLVLGVAHCGRGGGIDDKITSADAQAAYVGQDLTQVLSVSMEAYIAPTSSALEYEFGGRPQLPEGYATIHSALTEEQMNKVVSEVKTQLDKSTSSTSGCVAVAPIDSNSLKITFTNCAFGQIKVSGSMTCAFAFERVKRELLVTVTFADFTVNGRKVEGTLKVAVGIANKTELKLATEGSLKVTTKENKTAELQLNATVALSPQKETMTLNGTGTVNYDETSYNITAKDVVVKFGDGAPSSGSVSVTFKSGKLQTTNTVEIVFSSETVTSGKVEVKVNGKSVGMMTSEELLALLKRGV